MVQDVELMKIYHESQIHNVSTNRTQSVQQLDYHLVLCLTGTPVQNRLTDLQSLIMLLKVHPWDEGWIRRSFIVPQMNVGAQKAIRSLNLLMDAVFLRRTKDVLLNLPEKVENYVLVHVSSKWDKELRDLHNTFIQYFGQQRTTAEPWDSHKFFRQLTMLRQFCNHPLYARLDIENKHTWKWEDSGKIIHLVENLDEFLRLPGHRGIERPKAVIFSSYTGFLGM